jgi:hypothetical protein
MSNIWTPTRLVCHVCGAKFAPHQRESFNRHLLRCVERHADFVDGFRLVDAPFEGDPELNLFARIEGDVYNRRAGTRRKPR